MAQFNIINSRGEKEIFSTKKIYESARRVGASPILARQIAEILKKEVSSGDRTAYVYKRIKQILSKKSPQSALKFSLKDGMRRLGPTGFPFEKYIGAVLRESGLKVKLNQILPGSCIRGYEIDFIAEKGNSIYVGECKYRNYPGERIHTKDVLANYARFLDISNGPYFKSKVKTMMVTNAKFTNRARDYAKCVGIELLGWRWPKDKGLEYLIEKEKTYPITILSSLNKRLKDIFVSQKIMLTKDVLKVDPQKFSRKFKVQKKDLDRLIAEASLVN